MKASDIDAIVIHCSASRAGQDLRASDIDKMHKERGFAMIGYNYVIELDGKVLPIEIKSGKDYYRHNAMDNVLQQSDYGIKEGYVFCGGNIEQKDRISYFPIYMLMFLQKKELPDEILFETDFSDLGDQNRSI